MAEHNRGNDVSRSEDVLDDFKVGIKDIDTAIYYYFNEVIKPNVIQNGKTLNVPVVYGSPERWKAMQNDGYYRDKNGKMQAPLIVFRRETVEKNRNIGNKLDGNDPKNFGVFKQTHSKKNIYDRFSAVNNRIATEEYFAVAIPDYVNITYSCVIFTDYVEQNNKLVEAINFASDSYWGDPSKFHFRAMIDTYTTSTEIVQGSERIVKSNFNINLLGHIVTDTVNALAVNSKKYFSKAAVKVTSETVKNINDL
tara:strand:+ start:2610 stop:3365 length:756 start_codon:yes stop_codon:yes gene_type:complete